MNPRRIVRVAVVAALVATGPAALVAQEAPAADADGPSVEELRAQIESLRALLEERLAELEERLTALEESTGEPGTTGEGAAASGELEAIRAAAAAAAAAAGGATPVESPAAPQEAPVGHERNLSLLNPEVSITGDILAVGGDVREDFQAREFELDLQSALDPYSRMRVTIAYAPEDDEVEVEEGYVLYNGLPGGLELKAGKFRQRFGPLNQQHLHALPQVDYPLALATYFDTEGLAQTGLSLAWVLPHSWADANEVIVELTDGSNPAFGGEDFDRLVGLARLKNFWDVGDATYVEWGLSGISGRAAGNLDSRVLGTDLTVHWQPPARAKYRELTWRSELLRSRRDLEDGTTAAATGWYSYLEGLVARNLYLGVRYDQVEDPFSPELETTGWFPYLTWWQSEYVRLRAQYGRLEPPVGEAQDQFTLQLTYAAGPHKHESY